MANYRDNYPYNIEAPQRVYVQYSQEISFDYSNGNYPTGESYEGFIWENIYIPVPHKTGSLELGKHVWMRWRIGEKESWTLPMRFTDSFTNIETTTLESIQGTSNVRFRFKYTLMDGSIIYSEYMVLSNGKDGKGIISSEIINNNLVFTYSDGTTQTVGRVVGYDGFGIPVGANNDDILTYLNGEAVWRSTDYILSDLQVESPILFDGDTISHLDSDGNRHIPVGGTYGQVLSTDGAGVYSWVTRLETFPIDDYAGTGDTDKVWSADKTTAMFASFQTAGIKYSVPTETDLATIVLPLDYDLAVVEDVRYVYQYLNSAWNEFFALDAPHNHNDLYYTKVELNTSNGGGLVHWDNVTNKPTFDFFTSFQFEADYGDGLIDVVDSDIIQLTSNNSGFRIGVTGKSIDFFLDPYTAGTGIDIVNNVISHEDTSTVINTTNGAYDGNIIKNLTFDSFGHVTGHTNYNLDNRYSLLNHTHTQFTQYPTTWTTLPLASNWTTYNGIPDASPMVSLAFRYDSIGVIRIRGILRSTASIAENADILYGTLPYKPTSTFKIPIAAAHLSLGISISDPFTEYIYIDVSGHIRAAITLDSNTIIYLDFTYFTA